jgi:hypothetical protein
VKCNVILFYFKHVKSKAEYIRRVEDVGVGGSAIFVGGRWAELGSVKFFGTITT